MVYSKALLSQILHSNSVNRSSDIAKYFNVGGTVSMQLFLLILKILCINVMLNQGHIVFHLCWLSRLCYRCYPVKALANCTFVFQVETSSRLAGVSVTLPKTTVLRKAEA